MSIKLYKPIATMLCIVALITIMNLEQFLFSFFRFCVYFFAVVSLTVRIKPPRKCDTLSRIQNQCKPTLLAKEFTTLSLQIPRLLQRKKERQKERDGLIDRQEEKRKNESKQASKKERKKERDRLIDRQAERKKERKKERKI